MDLVYVEMNEVSMLLSFPVRAIPPPPLSLFLSLADLGLRPHKKVEERKILSQSSQCVGLRSARSVGLAG